MVYCPRCGFQNPEGARFCNSCGAVLAGPPRHDPGKEWEAQCERDCGKSPKGARIFWGIVLILVALWILFEVVLKNISGMPDWVVNFQFWWIFPLIIVVLLIVWAVQIMTKK